MNDYPRVNVIGHPDYPDFEGVLLQYTDDWPFAVVGYELPDGTRRAAVIPDHHISTVDGDTAA